MTDMELMELGIHEMGKCTPADPKDPLVGAVVAINGEMKAVAHRENGDHAEMLALEKISADLSLENATVYTTLEPCTHGVRREASNSCTDRLIRCQVKRVVVGILDPNQGVCGKGLLELQKAKIEVALFPNDLAQKIRRANRDFITAQESLGMRITTPQNGMTFRVLQKRAEFRGATLRVEGTFTNPPGDNVVGMTYIAGEWWPQLSPVRVIPEKSKKWEIDIDIGVLCPCKIYIVRATKLGMELISYYRRMVNERNLAIYRVSQHFQLDPEEVRQVIAPVYWGLTMATLPKGLDIEDCIEIDVTGSDC